MNPAWFHDLVDADAEVKRRLEVARFHRHRARRIETQYLGFTDTETRIHAGGVWVPYEARHFSLVPKSHPDFVTAGSISLYTMERVKDAADGGDGVA